MEKVIDRISKLLMLSQNNQNEAEAGAALLKARALMAKYNIDQQACEIKEKRIVNEENLGFVVRAQWEEWLFALICKNFRCQGYYRMQMPVFIGLQADLQIAVSVYRYVHRFALRGAERAYRKAVRETGTGRNVKASYYRGFVVGLKKQFEEATAKESTEIALIMNVPIEVQEYYQNMSQELEERRFRQTEGMSMMAYEQGYCDGNRLPKIHGTIESSDKK